MRSCRFFFVLLSILSLLVFPSCAAESDDAIGNYSCARLEMDGEEFHVLDIYPNGCTLQLSRWGQAWLNFEDESFYGRWDLAGDEFTLDINGTISRGTLKDGVCVLRLADSNMEHSFLMEGANLPQDTTTVQQTPLTSQQIFWNGDWYGHWSIKNAEGIWLDQSGQSFDCFAVFSIDGEGKGTMSFWDEMQDKEHPIAKAEIYVDGTGDDASTGVLITTGGSFLDAELANSQWSAEPADYPFDSVFYIENAHYEGENGAFDYSIVLRPWGRTWEDVEAVQPDMLPYYYHDWYLPTLAKGGVMPDSFEYTQGTVIRNTWSEPKEE